jgi:nucleotide-binding universal stress UspA family protein
MKQLRRRLYRNPVPPRAINAVVPAWLQEIILHCLAIDAGERYASAAQVAFDLANPAQVPITERGTRARQSGVRALLRQWRVSRQFVPAPCPPPPFPVNPLPLILVAIDPAQLDDALFDAMRDATRRLVLAVDPCRIALVAVVPPAASLTGDRVDDTATGRHIKFLVNLRRWARPLALQEERVSYHVLESEKTAAALIDYAKMNDVDQILLGGSRSRAATRMFPGVGARVVAEAPCSVTVVRPRSEN